MDFDLYTWVYLITNLFSLVIIHKFVVSFFTEIINKKYICWLSYLLYFISTSIVYLLWDIPLLTLITNIIALFAIIMNYQASLKRKIIATLYIYIFMLVPELLIGAITNYFDFPMLSTGYYNNSTGLILVKIVTYVESLIFYNIKSIKRNHEVGILQWIASLFIPVSTLSMKLFLIDPSTSTKFGVVISTLFIFVINLMTFYLYDSLAESYNQRTKATLFEKEREMYFNQCLLMQETNEHLHKFRHEINNQFISMKELINKRMYNELDAFVEKLTDKLEIEKIYSNTGNVVVDSIINYKLNLLNNANVVTEIAVPSSLEVDINDLVIILGNILDNAVKALNENEQDSKLYFKLVYSQGRLLIKETNTYKTRICYENGKIQSSKADKVNHGLGLKNVEDAVKRHDGYMEINHNDNIFSIDIILFV